MWEFEAIGLPALQNELTGLEDALADPSGVLALVAPEVGADIKQNFLAGGRPETWPDITAASRAQRKVNKTSGPLIDTEALMNAASASSAAAPARTARTASRRQRRLYRLKRRLTVRLPPLPASHPTPARPKADRRRVCRCSPTGCRPQTHAAALWDTGWLHRQKIAASNFRAA